MNSQIKKISSSAKETKNIGESLALSVSKNKTGALVIVLNGDIGSGKTTFVQGFAKGLGVKEKITSPTFVIMKKFKIHRMGFNNLFHLDCYRITKPKEILSLGFKEIISDNKNIVLIEWAENIRRYLPKNKIVVHFDFIDENTRSIASN